MELFPSLSTVSPTIIENETSESSGMKKSNVEPRPAWNRPPSNEDSENMPVLGAFSWPQLSETKKAPSKSSSSLRSMGDGSGTSSSSVSLYQKTKNAVVTTNLLIYAEELLSRQINTSVSANGTVAQPSGQSLSRFPESSFHRGQNESNEIASQSHGGTQNQYQWKSYKNQDGNHHHHQRHGGIRNHNHENQNFNRISSGFAQAPRGLPRFVRHAPPPPMPPILAQYMLSAHQPFYHFGCFMVYHNSAPPLMYYQSPCIPFIEPASVNYQVQETSLETRIRNQVHFYLSEENLKTDDFMRRRMNDEGFVHIQFIAGFKKLKALTSNIQHILDALQGSYLVELKGYEIRNRHMWRKYLMPLHLRVPFDSSIEDEMTI